jgi:phosphatidylglycerol:prolipoprotein diacylglycerol transferase
MYPRLFTIGHFTLHTYGVLMAVAFLLGLWVASRQARRAGIDAARVADLGVYSLIAGLLGAKLMLLLVDWHYYSGHTRELLSLFQSAGVFYGGLILGVPVALWFARRARLPLWPTLDVLAPGVAIGQAVGRLGCLAAGCCYGKPTTSAWAITFRDPYATRTIGTPTDIPLYPTQIYESLLCLVLFLGLIWLAPRKKFNGQVAVSYLIAYAVIRFGIEFLRGDVNRGFVFHGALSTSQFIAILVFLGALGVLPYLARRQRVKTVPAE